MRRKARRRRIRDPRCHHQTRHVSCLLGRFQHRPARLVVRGDRNGAIVALLRAGEGSRTSGRIGNEGRGGACARLSNKVLVDDELFAKGSAVLKLHKAARQAETGRAHSVRDHEDEVAFPRRVGTVFRALGGLLVDDGQDDDERRGDDAPDEQEDFAPEPPCSWA